MLLLLDVQRENAMAVMGSIMNCSGEDLISEAVY